MVTSVLGTLSRYGKKFGPYLMMEILLPGGTLLALLLFLYQSKPSAFSAAPVQPSCGDYCFTESYRGRPVDWRQAVGFGPE